MLQWWPAMGFRVLAEQLHVKAFMRVGLWF